MSIAAMNWVWSLRLRPSVKFVLLALADAADDNGVCWPSVATIANKTCLEDRSVQRILSKVKMDGLLEIERRYKNAGAPTSNRYRLTMKTGGDKTSPPPIPADSQVVVTESPPPGDASVTQTTNESSVNPQPLPSVSCGGPELIFPKQFSGREMVLATQHLSGLPPELAQEVLDELAARMNAGAVRGSPLGYLRTLASRAKEGAFSPEAGVQVAAAREREREQSLARQTQPVSRILTEQERKERIGDLYRIMARQPKTRQESQNG